VPSRQAKAAVSAGIVSRYPRESVGLFVMAGAIAMIFANALFMQHGPHPAPIFAHKPAVAPVRHAAAPALSTAVPEPAPRPHIASPTAPPRDDPIARLLAPSDRVVAVQRVLTQFGYGQIRPTGVVGPDTHEAIRRFERSRHMTVTGEMSDDVVKALAQVTGQRID
jgi:hypothetical protein